MSLTQSLKKVTETVMSPNKLQSVMTDKNVMRVALLFAALSPGLLVQVPSQPNDKYSVEWMNMKTSTTSVLMHALIFFSLLMCMNVSKDKVFAAVLLFILLSPGFLLELPSKDDHVISTNRTSTEAVMVHTLVFMVLYGTLA